MFDIDAGVQRDRLGALATRLNRELDEVFVHHSGEPEAFIFAVLSCHPSLGALPDGFLALVADHVARGARIELTP